jgi:peroxiredoxin
MVRSTLLFLALTVSAGCGATPPADPPAGTASAPAAPPLQGRSTEGGEFSLKDVAGGPAVVLFVRGSFCPVCRERLRALAASTAAYRDAGARVVAVTLDAPPVASDLAHELGLALPLVSVDAATFRRWGVWSPGQPMPHPGDFVLDPLGRIRYARIGTGAADRASDVALLGILDSLHAAGALARR